MWKVLKGDSRSFKSENVFVNHVTGNIFTFFICSAMIDQLIQLSKPVCKKKVWSNDPRLCSFIFWFSEHNTSLEIRQLHIICQKFKAFDIYCVAHWDLAKPLSFIWKRCNPKIHIFINWKRITTEEFGKQTQDVPKGMWNVGLPVLWRLWDTAGVDDTELNKEAL